MYARLVTFNIGPGNRDMATGMADAALKMVKEMDGFVSATYLIINEESGDYGSFTVWESAAHANAAAETLQPWMVKEAGPRLTAPPVVRMAEVYQPA